MRVVREPGTVSCVNVSRKVTGITKRGSKPRPGDRQPSRKPGRAPRRPSSPPAIETITLSIVSGDEGDAPTVVRTVNLRGGERLGDALRELTADLEREIPQSTSYRLVEGAHGTRQYPDTPSAGLVNQLAEDLTPSQVPPPALLLQARRSAAAREQLLREWGALEASEVADLAGSRAKNRSALASRLAAEGKLFWVPWAGRQVYPAFQLDHDGQVRPLIARVLQALPSERSAWFTALWFCAVSPSLDARPVDLLDDVEQQERIVEAAREVGAPLVL